MAVKIHKMQESRAFTLFYVAYYAYFAYVVAFFSLRALDLGVSKGQLSIATALIGLCLMLSPLTFQYAGEHLLPRQTLTRAGLLLASVFTGAHLVVEQTWLSVWLAAGGVFCARGALCLVDGECLNKKHIKFEWVRGIGSASFIVSVASLGFVFERYGSYYGVALTVVFLGGAFIFSEFLGLNTSVSVPENWRIYARSQLRSVKKIFPLLAACFFSWLPQGAATAYFSAYLEELGWTKTLIGAVWAFSVTCEVIFFVLFPWIEKRFSLIRVLQLSLLLGAVRWVLTATLENNVLIFLVQSLHSFSFAGSYLACMKLVRKCLSEENWHVGQGWLTTFGLAPGSITGAMLGGLVVTYFELPDVFIALGVLSLFGIFFAGRIKLVNNS